MKKNKKKNYRVAANPAEVAEALGLYSPVDQAYMIYKAEISSLASKAIKNSGLEVNEIVKRSGVARSKVSAIKNGAIAGISIDLFLKVILASGSKLTMKLAS